MVRFRRKSRLSKVRQEELIKYFVAGSTARSAAVLVGVNRHTATLYFHKLREVIAWHLERENSDMMSGKIELDESYFGGHRKGKRGRGAAGKIPVFGLLKRAGKVYAIPISNARSSTLLPIINEKIKPDSIVYTDSFVSYDVLDVSQFHHERINHSTDFADGDNHINGIENFWSQAKRHLRHFNGIPKEYFHLYLKECEWRFNYRPTQNLLKVLIEWTL